MTTFKGLLGVAAVLALAGAAHAALTITGLGTAAPPTTWSGGDLIAAPLNPAPVFADVSSAPLDFDPDKNVLFSIPLSHRTIGFGWATWSHGYTGDVYYTNGALSVTMTFDQTDMQAFYFYAEPNPFRVHDFTVTAVNDLGESVSASAAIDGASGAQGFLITAPDLTRKIMSITVSSDVDFAIGEFGYAKTIPAPAALALLGLAGLASRRRRA